MSLPALKTSRNGTVATLMVALLTACVAFQLNASMLSPALVTMGEELNTDQAADPGFNIGATQMSLLILTPYALFGWVFGPITGRLAPVLGYTKMLRIGLLGSVAALTIIGFLGLHSLHSLPMMITGTVLLGIMYAGTVNIMLNGLGVVLSAEGNPGFLPGMNAGAFNLGAGLSFLVLPAILVTTAPLGGQGFYLTVVVVAMIITAAAFASSMLVPKPIDAEVAS